MLVSQVIKALQEDYKPDEEIMIQWFAKEHLEFGEEINQELWDLAVRLFEKYEMSPDDFGIPTCLLEAQERLEARSS